MNSKRGIAFRNAALSVTVGLSTYFAVEFFKFAPVVIKYLSEIRTEQVAQRKDIDAFKKAVIEEHANIKASVTQNTSAITVITMQQTTMQADINSNASALISLSNAFAIRGYSKKP